MKCWYSMVLSQVQNKTNKDSPSSSLGALLSSKWKKAQQVPSWVAAPQGHITTGNGGPVQQKPVLMITGAKDQMGAYMCKNWLIFIL